MAHDSANDRDDPSEEQGDESAYDGLAMKHLNSKAVRARNTGFRSPRSVAGRPVASAARPGDQRVWSTPHDRGLPPHSRDNSSRDYPSLKTVTHGKPKLGNALANYGLGRSGRIYVIDAGEAWHAGIVKSNLFSNPQEVGIEAENNGVGERWAAPMLEA